MNSTQKPSEDELPAAVRKLRERGYSYAEIGASMAYLAGAYLAGSDNPKAIRAALRKAADSIKDAPSSQTSEDPK